jgi:hypothetical protein
MDAQVKVAKLKHISLRGVKDEGFKDRVFERIFNLSYKPRTGTISSSALAHDLKVFAPIKASSVLDEIYTSL